MKIEIDNKEYNFEVNGTVGLTFMVEQMVGEDFSFENKKHIYYLYYAILATSNKDIKDLSLDWFLSHLTAKVLEKLDVYTAERWKELEGISTKEEEDNPKNE